jgi:hypothetical protein
MVGWLSWKAGVEGFEYWDVSSWANCMKTMGNRRWIDEVESPWTANAFGDYNGDGYLCYPGPNRTILSSLRFEALRDGFEDYEYLAVLKRKLAGKQGAQALAAKKLLDIPDTLCAKDLSFTSDPAALFATRHALSQRPVDLSAGRPSDRGAIRGSLSSWSRMVPSAGSGLDLSDAGTRGPGRRRRSR